MIARKFNIGAVTSFWTPDRNLSVFLGTLVVAVFILSPLGITLLTSIGFSLLLISGVMAVADSRAMIVFMVGSGAAALVAHWVQHLVQSPGLALLDALSSMWFFGLLAGLILIETFKKGPITVHRIQGAISVYLLLGLIWAFAYDMVALHFPGSFQSEELKVHHGILTPIFIYFSFTTLTTAGYGDITPVHPIARSLAMLEALTGQLFPAILLGRLVAMELQYKQLR